MHVLVDNAFEGKGHREGAVVIAFIGYGRGIAIAVLHGADGSICRLKNISVCSRIVVGIGSAIEVEVLLQPVDSLQGVGSE